MYETKQVFAMQVLDLLRRSLLTTMPFSDVFLPYRYIGLLLGSKELTETMKPRKIRKPHPRNNMRLVLDKMTLKLMVSKSRNEVLYAEAGADFVDFIFRILTLPLGSVIKILGGNTNMGCIDNLYKSTGNNYIKSEKCRSMLLSPKIPQHYNCDSQLFDTKEGIELAKGYEVVNPKSPSLETASGGGFVNDQITYIVTDELSVKPL
ncbi:hypothetical protein GIB67_028689 [Kingdonia uniflora]|uniref:Uncharacterized protein n=1 Tax=Kingdonia uniflora TaxID=39325 RepID=A0A7J7N9Z4_9MAGN|nr:hypothetical protein GIB67_028689 [Kingdonia uniflora]